MATATQQEFIPALEAEFDELREYAHDQALTSGFITEEDEAWLHQIGIQSYTPVKPGNSQTLEDAAIAMAERTQDPAKLQGVLNLTGMMEIDRIIMNALSSAYRASVTPEPYKQFVDFLNNGLQQEDKENRKDFITALKAAKKDMVISVLQTMHPTIYHTHFAREMETKLTGLLEQMAIYMNTQPSGDRTPEPTLKQEIADTINELIKGVRKGKKLTYNQRVTLGEENQLDHDSHVAMRTNFEKVIKDYNEALENVADSLLKTGAITRQEHGDIKALTISRDPFEWRTWALGADADGRPKSTSPVLWQYIDYQTITRPDETKEYLSRKRDVRENSDDHMNAVSCLVQRAFLLGQEEIESEKEFPEGTQQEYYKRFAVFCHNFAREIEERNEGIPDWRNSSGRKHWENPEHSILQQLNKDEQAEFLRRIVTGDVDNGTNFQFLPAAIREETIAFNRMFSRQYREFLLHNQDRLQEELGITVETIRGPDGKNRYLLPEVDSLMKSDGKPSELLIDLCRLIAQEDVKLYAGTPQEQTARFNFSPSALIYERAPQSGAHEEGYIANRRLFLAARTLNSDGNPVLLNHVERRKMLEVIKRAYILDHATRAVSNTVCDRYQISEFGSAADFYAAMLLFKEAGIIKVKDKKVSEQPAICIQPLLETSEDQANGRAIFEKLLEDPLVRSYYKQLGRAEVMFGCSDGAKSAGNFSSEWSNYIHTREIQGAFLKACDTYDDLKGTNLRLRVLYGRGHGDSRGGHMAEGQNQRMMSPEMAEDMIYDVTIQSDEHMQMMISDRFGQDTGASILQGTITAKYEAEQEKRKSTEYHEWMKGMEKAIGKIANNSREGFRDLVSRKPATMVFIDTIHDNPLKSSRNPKRTSDAAERDSRDVLDRKLDIDEDTATENLDNTRAITVEYAFQAMADFPAHYLGMRKALQNFINDHDVGIPKSPDDPTPVYGLEALQSLYQNHPFFRNMVDKTKVAMKDYDPDVFRQYAKIAGVSDWAKDCIAELDGPEDNKGLMQLLDEISDDTPALETGTAIQEALARKANQPLQQRAYATRSRNLLRQPATILDKLGHIIPFSLCVRDGKIQSRWDLGGNPLKPDRASTDEHEKLRTQIVDNCSAVVQEQHAQNLKFPGERVLADVDNTRQAMAGRA